MLCNAAFAVGCRWFDSAHGFTATLPCSAKPPGRPDDGQLPYLIRVFTSGVKGAGTDANISLNLMGLKGSSGWQQLHARQEAFERGKVGVHAVQLGELHACTPAAMIAALCMAAMCVCGLVAHHAVAACGALSRSAN